MDRTTLWSRVGDWIRHPRRWNNSNGDQAQVEERLSYPVAGEADSGTGNGHRRTWLGFRSHRRQFEEQSRQVSELVRGLQSQAERQTRVAESANANLERLITSLAVLPGALQSQQEALLALQRQVSSQAVNLKHVQEVLDHLEDIGAAVKQNSAALAEYSEAAQKSSESVVSELQRQGQSVAQIAQSSVPLARAVTDMRVNMDARGEELAQSVASLNKRLTQFASAALILAMVAAIIGVVAFFR